MHLQSCEHPVIVRNTFSHELQSVPCGKCNTCLMNYANSWITRLEQERLMSGYTVFFTLTYEDRYLPLCTPSWSSDNIGIFPDCLCHVPRNFNDLDNNRNKKHLSDEFNDFSVLIPNSVLSEQSTKNIMRRFAGNLPYCSVYDIQNFTKRLKSKLYRTIWKTDKGLQEEQKVRYFIACELGPTTLRPHYHGLLFFDRREISEAIFNILSESWKFGNIDYKFVTSSATSYVAKYVNSFSSLPRIYQIKGLCPFHVSSKSSPIGIRALTDSTVRDIFNSSSCLMPCSSPSLDGLSLVPLWRCFEDRLFPKLPRDSSISFEVRFRLLYQFTHRTSTSFQEIAEPPLSSFHDFCDNLALQVSKLCSFGHNSILLSYLDLICPFWNLYRNDYAGLYSLFLSDNSVKRCYYVVRRITCLCYRMSCTLFDYVCRFNTFQSNKQLYRLREYYTYQADFSLHSPACVLLGMDNVFFSHLRCVSLRSLTSTIYTQLSGYGLSYSDVQKIYHDEKSKKSFFRQIHYSKQLDMVDVVNMSALRVEKSRKTRKKNEYLQLHPELKNLY